jgi:hypothetical protein
MKQECCHHFSTSKQWLLQCKHSLNFKISKFQNHYFPNKLKTKQIFKEIQKKSPPKIKIIPQKVKIIPDRSFPPLRSNIPRPATLDSLSAAITNHSLPFYY